MGKKQHSKDRLFITSSEYATEWGGYKEKKISYRRLPFYCCALSLQPFEHPYCTRDGYVFDLTTIFPYIRSTKSHPITGNKLTPKDLIKCKFYKNNDDEYHCPITLKIFNKSSHIVCIASTGNVYSYNAIKQLNIDKNIYKDLINDKPFNKNTDIIVIQNPQKPEKQNVQNFMHIKQKLVKQDGENKKYQIDNNDNSNNDNNNVMNDLNYNPNIIRNHAQIRHNSATKRIFSQIQQEHKNEPPSKKIKLSSGDKIIKNKDNKFGLYNIYTTGKMAASATSTAMTPVYKDEYQPYTEKQIREERWRMVKGNGKKSYVRLITNMGDLNFELDCDYVPKTCYNFIEHCLNGYYDNTIFHRNIMSFMIQGGDPLGTGRGGKCAWKTSNGKFEDEFNKLLKHDKRGIIAMANNGANTNGSQFYILYQPAPHLDDKHSVFGRLVGGMNVLNRMEEVEVNETNDKPIKAIKILKTMVYINPFDQPLPHQIKQKAKDDADKLEKLNKDKGNWWSNPTEGKSNIIDNDNDNKFEIGKYIKDKALLKSRYGKNGTLVGKNVNNNLNKKKKKKKKKRKKFVLPKPKINNLLNNNDKTKTQSSVFRFKDFEISKKD